MPKYNLDIHILQKSTVYLGVWSIRVEGLDIQVMRLEAQEKKDRGGEEWAEDE